MSDFEKDISIPVPPEPPMPPLPPIPGGGKKPRRLAEIGIPVGSVIAFAGKLSHASNPPSPPDPEEHITDVEPLGWLLCDGREFYIIEYPDLFDAIGNFYGGLEGETFKIPDYRGYFLRAVDETEKVDKDRKNREVGSVQEDALQTHAHGYTKPDDPINYQAGEVSAPMAVQKVDNTAKTDEPTETDQQKTDSVKVKLSEYETRPKNIYVYFMIKCF